jgi:hypothetical protein
VAAATETETALTAEAAAIGWRRHRQWRRRKHRDNNDGNDRQQRLRRGPGIAFLSTTVTGTTTTITTMATAAVTMTTIIMKIVGRRVSVLGLTGKSTCQDRLQTDGLESPESRTEQEEQRTK